MTDTTDIAALWKLAAEVSKRLSETLTACNRRGYCDEALNNMKDALELAISTAEAERQRADNASFRENHLNDMLNDKIQQNVDLRAEIAALKAEQVPVGWEVCSPEWCNKHNACHEAPRIWFESEDGTGPHYHPSEYIAPQKLTDLSYDVLFNAIAKSATPLGEHMSISVKDFKAAIESAGGIVKDGE